ncbi:DUF5320 domain-containing protein [Clostridium oryzae]|uniref:Uncharacterized protein n=1 Tax=Clostridium oryzae TaxID=1450648 RepID=A0A1V4ICL7_9CLOT|nr:DUF5320 domain-containing protein [Clostridium oryzae]OPJ57679.1 hypothetical protein CLORY_39980 [Clostridium oryzae]
MPGRDGTGPIGLGDITVRGMGICNFGKTESTTGVLGLRLGLNCRRGFRRNRCNSSINFKNQKDLLIQQKVILENALKSINDKLDTLQDNQ